MGDCRLVFEEEMEQAAETVAVAEGALFWDQVAAVAALGGEAPEGAAAVRSASVGTVIQ